MKIIRIENSLNPFYKEIVVEATEDHKCVWDSFFGPRIFWIEKGRQVSLLITRSEVNRSNLLIGEEMDFCECARLDFQRLFGGHQIPWQFLY